MSKMRSRAAVFEHNSGAETLIKMDEKHMKDETLENLRYAKPPSCEQDLGKVTFVNKRRPSSRLIISLADLER